MASGRRRAGALRPAASERGRFLRSFVANPRSVGAVLPTSRRTVRAMLDLASVERARLVVELGAGTGPQTREILSRLPPDGRLLAFEVDCALAQGLAAGIHDPRLRVIADSAEHLERYLDGERPDVIVSALPFTSLPAGVRDAVLAAAARALARDGVMVVLQYSPFVRRRLERTFGSVDVRLSPANVPPAVLFRCRDPERQGRPAPAEAGGPLGGPSRRTLREARRYLVAALALEAVLAPLGVLRGRLFAGTAAACALFFRDPARMVRVAPNTVYAPADGVVVGVDTAAERWLPGADALRISIFLALYDVHVSRSPVSGRITRAEEVGGGFAPAFLSRASGNHRKRLAIDGDAGRVVLVQIAGMLARRISSWAWLGDRVAAGQRIGFIHFGSRTDVLLRESRARALVAIGQRVRAGVTPIADYAEEVPPS
jgi:phosphatidylserine decarboxylase precursor-related protein